MTDALVLTPDAKEHGVPVRRRSPLWGAGWEVVYVVSQFGVKLARGVVIPFFLLPAQYGLWASLGVVLSYTRFSDLGAQYQLQKRLPLLLGARDEAGFRRLSRVGTTWTLATSAIIAIGLLVASRVYAGANADFYRTALAALAALIVAQGARTVWSSILQSREEFRVVALQRIIADVSSLVLAIPGVIYLGPLGLVAALVASEILGAAYCALHLAGLGVSRPAWSREVLTSMLREGLLLLGVIGLETQMMVTDQLFAIRWYSTEAFGLYAFAAFGVSALLSVTSAFMVNTPRVLALHAEARAAEAEELVAANLVLYTIFIVAAIPLYLVSAAWVVSTFLPKYAAGIGIALLMPIVAIARGPFIVLRSRYLALHQEKKLLLYQVVGTILIAGVCALAVWRAWPIAVLCVATASGYALLAWLATRPLASAQSQAASAAAALTLVGLVQVALAYTAWSTTHQLAWLLASCVTGALLGALTLVARRRTWAASARVYLRGTGRTALARVERWLARVEGAA